MTAKNDNVKPDLEDPCAPPKNVGLRGVVVADSTICKVDGQAGKLNYRGFDVVTLAENATFEEVVHLLLFNALPRPDELAALKRQLAQYRNLPDSAIHAIKQFPVSAHPMDVLQSLVPFLGMDDPDLDDDTKEATYRKALRLIARFPLLISAWDRYRKGLSVVEADPDLDHAANLLYTLLGETPNSDTARDLDLCLTLHAEHSFNASTFTARQIASTRAHIYASISGAVGSLSGELHGGANARVYAMLEKIGSVDKAEAFVRTTLDEGGLIMGMGHAVYKVLDPRAKILGPMSKRLSERTGDLRFFEISEKVRQTAARIFKERKGIDINANVDFYSATVYHVMGFETDLFTPLFAIARVAGWAAHVIEEKFAEAQPKPALYRPRAEYKGRYCGPDGCEWVPPDKR